MARQQPPLADERLMRWAPGHPAPKGALQMHLFPHSVTRSCAGTDRVAIRNPGASVPTIRRHIDVHAHRMSLSPEQRWQSQRWRAKPRPERGPGHQTSSHHLNADAAVEHGRPTHAVLAVVAAPGY